MARAHGATLLDRTPVDGIRPLGGEIEVMAGGRGYRCRRLVIAAGPWSNQALAPFGVHLPLRITQEQVTYFASPHADDFRPERFPVWIWMDDPCYYGFPVFGEPGPKVGQDAGGEETGANTRTFERDDAAFERVVRFLDHRLPSALGPVLYTRTCLYTLTPDRDFVLDTLPERRDVAVAIGGGHGYKFASVIGRILADLAVQGQSEHDLTPFRIDRAILQLADPPRTYMV
jgi:sarcosine oxidase